MTQEEEAALGDADSLPKATDAAGQPAQEREKAPPVESRFMFVDIAALRAKQLRRGALPRVDSENVDADGELVDERDRKLERIAMAEVQAGLIMYDAAPPPSLEEKEQAERDAAEAIAGEGIVADADTTEDGDPES